MPNPRPLRDFVQAVTQVLNQAASRATPEAALLASVTKHLATLVARDDWLPEALAQPHPQHYTPVPAACRCAGAVFGRQLRLGPGPANAGA